MLINATQAEEIRVAIVKDNNLYDLDVEKPTDVKKKANIYKARITRVEPSLEAAFVEYGAKRQGFLPLKEIAPEYFKKRSENDDEKPNIKSLLQEGQELMVQVDKEERGTKGAALTTFITLAGCYLVLMPNNPNSGGISRRIEGEERDELKEHINQLVLPQGMSLIVRTAGIGKRKEDLEWDLEFLLNQWQAIQNVSNKQPAPFLIHQDGDVVIRSIRDNLRKSIKEIIIDNHTAYVKAKRYIEQVKPDFLQHLKLYNDSVPLFSRYQIESQIEIAYQREVRLPSGGSLVIDRTEALVSIDINSAKATGGGDIETTALNTNIEAAEEIARQLRIRDLGGLVVIDFIDMNSHQNQRQVENVLKEALKSDRARIQVGRISKFGLLEMSRQRLRLSLGESNQEICPKCEGRGVVRSIHSNVFSLLRLIEEAALNEDTHEVQAQLPVEIATFLLNEKRESINQIEKRQHVSVVILPNPHIELPHYKISKVKNESLRKKPSYARIDEPELQVIKPETVPEDKLDEPAIKSVSFKKERNADSQGGFILRLWQSLFGSPAQTKPQKKKTTGAQKSSNRNQQGRNRHGGQQQRRHGNASGGGQRQKQNNNNRRHHHNRSGTNKNTRQDGHKKPQQQRAQTQHRSKENQS